MLNLLMTIMISQTGCITPPSFVPHRELLNLLRFYLKNTWQLNYIINLLSIPKNVFNNITLNLLLFTNPNIQQMNLILYCWSRSSFMLHWILVMSKIDSQVLSFAKIAVIFLKSMESFTQQRRLAVSDLTLHLCTPAC